MDNKVEFDQRIAQLENESLISTAYLKASTLVDFNVEPVKMLPYIVEAQELQLEPLIGSALYQALQDSNRTFEYDVLMDKYVAKTLIHWALSSYLNVAAFSVQQGGVFRHTSTDSVPLTAEDIELLVKDEQYKADTYSERLIGFLDTYTNTFPEYSECIAGGIKARQRRAVIGGWNLRSSVVRSSKNLCPECSSPLVGSSCSSNSCGYSSEMFVVEFWYGNSDIAAMGFDPDAELNKAVKMPNEVTAQPINSYYWIVSDKKVKIQQVGVDIPLGSFEDADQLTQVYVYGEDGGKHWIRINIIDTYESPVTFGVKTV